MPRRRRKKKQDDSESERSVRFWYTTIGILILFVVGFFILRYYMM